MFKRLFTSLLVLSSLSANAGVVRVVNATDEILVPVAGSVLGVGGVPFRSDIRITNLRGRTQLVDLYWLPQNVTGADIAPIRITLGPLNKLASEDFVAEVMDKEGLGAILVKAVQSDGTADEDAKLDVTSRVWSPARDDRGTVSLSLPSVTTEGLVNFQNVILGHKRSDDFRTNVGIVNLDTVTPQTYRITVMGDNPTLVPEVVEVTVAPRSMRQIALEGVEQPNMRVDIEALSGVPPVGRVSQWVSYGATVDNRSGDSWASIGFDIFDLSNQ